MEYTASPHAPRVALPTRFVGGVVGALVGALAIFYVLMRPPRNEIELMALFLSITALLSIAVGYGVYRLGWLNQAPHVSWTLLGGYALSSLLTFLNVWVTARLMFASQHDLLLATILLLFASGIAMSLGYFLSATLTSNIDSLNRAARAISAGALDTRVPVRGRDEVAQLARTFNEMAARLDQAAEQQRALDRLRRDLVAWAGHDLRTPLASIRAIVEALTDGVLAEPAEVDRYLRAAQREIRALSMLIDDLFEMAQLDAGGLPLEREQVAISDLISDTIEGFSALARQGGLRLAGEVAPGSDPLFIDATRVGRVLANLLGNALRHTPKEGWVRVRAAPLPGGEGVQIEVADSGSGIAPEDLPYIFDQFYRGEKSRSRATGGSGLGLAIARRVVEAHGGTIRAESELGQGTRILLTLPRA